MTSLDLTLLGACAALLLCAGAPGRSAEFFVSPTGDDAQPGTQAQPFATLARARAAVRDLPRAEGLLGEPVRVILRGGTYLLDEPLVFTAEDGDAAQTVTYAAFPGETPVLSGGTPITGWQVGEWQGRPAWTVTLPAVAAGEWYFRELFVNGRRAPRPRLPRTGYYRFADIPEAWRDKGADQPWANGMWNKGPDAAVYHPGELSPDWHNLTDIDAISLVCWFESHLPVKSVDEAQHLVTFAANSVGGLKDETGQMARYYLENVREALDEPGEWYLDRVTGLLTYLPLPGETPETAEVYAPRLDSLLHLRGTEEAPVRNLRFTGLTLRHAQWRYAPPAGGSFQAAFQVPGAVTLTHARDCVFADCEVSQLSPYAVEVGTGCSGTRLLGCTLRDLGAGGVKLNRGSERTEVADCTITAAGRVFPSAIGVLLFDSPRNRIHHNHISDLYYSGISCGWSWGYRQVAARDNRLEYNHIHDIGYGVLSDFGGIYTLSPQPGSIIRGNVIHDVVSYHYGAWGIYLDEGSSDFLVENNLTYRTKGVSFFQHYGRNNLVRNNIFALGQEGPISRGRQEEHLSFTVERNIFYWTQGPLFQQWENRRYRFDNNLYWRPEGPAPDLPPFSFADWQQMGQDVHGRVADPLFLDVAQGDFRLAAASPARELGFVPFDYAQAGPRPPEARRAAPEAPFVFLVSRLAVAEDGGRDQPSTATLTVTNVGDVPATGTYTVRFATPAMGRVAGPARFAITLAPGEERVETLSVTATQDLAVLEAVPEESFLLPTSVFFEYRVREMRVPRLAEAPAPAALPAALAALPDYPITYGPVTLGSCRATIAGEALAVVVEVRDPRLTPGQDPWPDTNVEVFASTPGEKLVRQAVFEVHGPTQVTPRLYENGREQPPHSAAWSLTPRADHGYTLAALIPLRELRLDPAADHILFDLAVVAAPRVGANRYYANLSRGVNSFMDNGHFVHLRLP